MKSLLIKNKTANDIKRHYGNGKLDHLNPTTNKKDIEWNPAKQWNPFNSYKLLAHVDRWRKIKRGRPIPPPILITVDPTNICQPISVI